MKKGNISAGQGGCSIQGVFPNTFSTEFGPSDTWLPIKLYQGRFQSGIRKNSFMERVSRHWNRLSWESGGVTMVEIVQKTCGGGTWGQVLAVALPVLGWWLDLMA